jgi:hypothetical protein
MAEETPYPPVDRKCGSRSGRHDHRSREPRWPDRFHDDPVTFNEDQQGHPPSGDSAPQAPTRSPTTPMPATIRLPESFSTVGRACVLRLRGLEVGVRAARLVGDVKDPGDLGDELLDRTSIPWPSVTVAILQPWQPPLRRR